MSSVQSAIANAILAGTPEARALALARATCQAVAQTQLACEVCGSIHDQRRIVVIEQGEDVEQLQTLAACCSTCWKRTIHAKMQKACGDAILWRTTWNGSERIVPESDKTLEILHSAYTIAQILAHYVERQKRPNVPKASDAHQLHASARIATDCSIIILDPSKKVYDAPKRSEPRFHDGRMERMVREILETPFAKRRKTASTDRVTVEDFGEPSYGIKDEEDNRHACRHFEDGTKIDERYFQTVLKTWGKQLQAWQSLKENGAMSRVFAIDRDGRTVAVIAGIERD